jgi:hypothetical protein
MYQNLIFSQKKWKLIKKDEGIEEFDGATILIHNMLFQLIRFSNLGAKNSRFLILFNDQVPKIQLQLFHLITAKNGIQ